MPRRGTPKAPSGMPTTATTSMTTSTPTMTKPASMTTTEIQNALDEAQLLLYRDRRRAHATLFGGKSRREHPTPPFHWQMIDDWHSDIRQLLQMGFGGCAKTTIGEEGATINAIFQEFRYCLIASSTDEIAEMRLAAIKKQ